MIIPWLSHVCIHFTEDLALEMGWVSRDVQPVLLRTRVSSRESNPNLQQFQAGLRKLEI